MSPFWYRYEDYSTAYHDPWGDDDQRGPSTPCVRERVFYPIRTTPKGVWLVAVFGSPEDFVRHVMSRTDDKPWDYRKSLHTPPRFVLREATKRFACPSEEEARESFYARKNRQIGIMQARIASIEGSMAALKAGRIGG